MVYVSDRILEALKAARKRKKLSQRELSTKSGVPQSHLSKIENGAVDLRVSSLIALARILDLELELVPKKTVPAIRSITRSSLSDTAREAYNETAIGLKRQKALDQYLKPASQYAYHLDEADDGQ